MFSLSALLHIKTGVSLKYFVTDGLLELAFHLNSPHIPSNVIPLTIFVALSIFTMF